ncbi:MAG: AraC family transcriptional regulator [Motiliproteus sp.]
MSNYTSANHYASVLCALAQDKGLDADRLLATAGISKDVLQHPRARVLTDKISSMVQQIWDELQDENMGLTLQPCRPGAFHMLGKLMVHAPSLGRAIGRGIQFYAILLQDYQLHLTVEGDEACFSIKLRRPELDRDNLLVELIMLSWHRFCSWLIGQHIILTGATFAYPRPPHIDEYQFLFPCPHAFDQGVNSFTFNTRYLNQAPIQSHESLKSFIAGCPTNLFVKHSNDESITTRVRLLIEADIANGFPDLVAMAEQLNMNKQTLRLKLKAEGSSYQQIKNLLRRDSAIYHLVHQPSLPISEIANLVGFSEPGVFIRAFKGWTGLTPGHYRTDKS